MSAFRVRDVQSFVGKQVILWLEDERSHDVGPGDGSQWCVRLPINEAPAVLQRLIGAYAECMQELLIDVAAGGCRTCGNRRLVDGGGPCPTCIPRAEKRIRERVMLPRDNKVSP